jgi:fumarate reductase subunit D
MDYCVYICTMIKSIIQFLILFVCLILPFWGSWELGQHIQYQFESSDLGAVARILFHVVSFSLTLVISFVLMAIAAESME